MLISVDFTIVGPLSHVSGCEVSYLVRSNAVWNTITMDTAFSKSMDGSLAETCSGKKNHNQNNYSSLPPGHWQVTPRNDAIYGAQHWSLLLADLALSSSCSQISVGEKCYVTVSCITSISATMATFFVHGSIGQ